MREKMMGATLQLNFLGITSSPSAAATVPHNKQQQSSLHYSRRTRTKPHAIETDTTTSSSTAPETMAAAAAEPQEPACIDFAFVSPRLLPDGTPDVHYRTAPGGQTLRDIMIAGNIDLYGPYDKPLNNCAGSGVCGTCIVEVVQGKEMLSPRTDEEKEKLKKKPKTWRLACRTMVGNPDSTGQMIIQQLPEWKIHEWKK